MDLIDFGTEETLTREEAADRLRAIADQLSRHNKLTADINGLKTTIDVPKQVTLEVEIEVGDDGNELEIEIRW